MSDDRLRIPQDADYFQAIGLATVAFARLEWNAVWCCERLSSGYIHTIEPERKTAGKIGKDLERLFLKIFDKTLKSKAVLAAKEFNLIVPHRNALMHGKPGTAHNGDQRLFRQNDELSVDVINRFSDRCVRAGMPLNALLYDELADPCSVALNP